MIEILRPGLQTSVQDLGRPGYRHLGVALCGALDGPALRLANRLVGNADNLAGLEITGAPVSIRFLRAACFALCGADCSASLDGIAITPGWRNHAAAGQTLKLSAARSGMRAYLAIDGGIDVSAIMGSRATDLQAHLGGVHGRALKAGDQLPLGSASSDSRRFGTLLPEWTAEIRALPGPEFEDFPATAQAAFFDQAWTVSPQSNRMGCRLKGPVLERNNVGDMLSHAVLPGCVQVPPNGQPIVLLADAQTTGGYPCIAVVIEADLWKFAQATSGTRLRFTRTDIAGAREAREKWARARARFELSAYGKPGDSGEYSEHETRDDEHD